MLHLDYFDYFAKISINIKKTTLIIKLKNSINILIVSDIQKNKIKKKKNNKNQKINNKTWKKILYTIYNIIYTTIYIYIYNWVYINFEYSIKIYYRYQKHREKYIKLHNDIKVKF